MIDPSASIVFASVISTIVWFHGAATLAAEIPWKIDEPTAQRLAAEAHYGADKYLDVFDHTSTMGHPFRVLRPHRATGSRKLRVFCCEPLDGRCVGPLGMPQIVHAGLAQIAGGDPPPFHSRRLKQYARLRRLRPECI